MYSQSLTSLETLKTVLHAGFPENKVKDKKETKEMTLLEIYQSVPYIKEITEKVKTLKEMKFESPQSFISFVEDIHTKGFRDSLNRTSEENSESFSKSKSLAHAFELFREAKYDKKSDKKTSLLVNKLRQRTGFFDEGDEIAVSEYVAGSEKHFLQHGKETRKQINAFAKIPLIIRVTYRDGRDCQEMQKIAQCILDTVYRHKIRFSKLVFSFASIGTIGEYDSRSDVFVESNYTDFNASAKMILPCTFRRIWFRLVEMHKDLNGGYGTATEDKSSIQNGINIEEFVGNSEEVIEKKVLEIIKSYLKKN